MEEYKIQIAHAAGRPVLPFSTFLHHHIAVLQAVEDNDLTPVRLRQIAGDNDAIADLQIELDKAWTAKHKKIPHSE